MASGSAPYWYSSQPLDQYPIFGHRDWRTCATMNLNQMPSRSNRLGQMSPVICPRGQTPPSWNATSGQKPLVQTPLSSQTPHPLLIEVIVIGVRAGGLGAAAPPTFGQFDFFGQWRKFRRKAREGVFGKKISSDKNFLSSHLRPVKNKWLKFEEFMVSWGGLVCCQNLPQWCTSLQWYSYILFSGTIV